MSISYARLLGSLSLPATMTIAIPIAILRGSATTKQFAPFLGMSGCLFICVGLCLLGVTIKAFVVFGKGTLAPWDPPQELVVSGLYGYVRNPMISGVLFIILGEAVAVQSVRLFCWWILFFVCNHLYFIFSEEPKLTKRFGNSYLEYKTNVPRWIPRISPWKASNTQ